MTSQLSALRADKAAWDARTAALARAVDKERAGLAACKASHAAAAAAASADQQRGGQDLGTGKVIWAPWLAGQPPVFTQGSGSLNTQQGQTGMSAPSSGGGATDPNSDLAKIEAQFASIQGGYQFGGMLADPNAIDQTAANPGSGG